MRTCKVEARTGFWVFLAMFYTIDPAQTFWPFCIAAALHEGGHILALTGQGIPIRSICFMSSGTVIHVGDLSYRQELIVSLAGPMVNGLLFFATIRRIPTFALINLALFCYNMLPLYPLDGGRLLRAFLQITLPSGIALRLEKGIGAVCLALLTGLAVYLTCGLHAGLWPVLLCAFLILRVGGTISSISNFLLDKQGIPCYNKQANSERCPSGLRSRS